MTAKKEWTSEQLEAVFSKGVPPHRRLKELYLEHVVPEGGEVCAVCGISEWLGADLVLQLDHADGDRGNNSLTNLRLLCPNCHSQTHTYCGRKKPASPRGGSRVTDQMIIDAVATSSNIRRVLLTVGLDPRGKNYGRVRRIVEENDLEFPPLNEPCSKVVACICAQCGVEFERFARDEENRRKKGRAGPFCGKACTGRYGKSVQLAAGG